MPPNGDLGKPLCKSILNDTPILAESKTVTSSETDDELKGTQDDKPVANKVTEDTSVLSNEVKELGEEKEVSEKYKPRLLWLNIISITLFHLLALYSLRLIFETSPWTWLWGFFLGGCGGFGVTGGAHRLWAHRSYKAKWPLKVILLICYSIAGQNTMYDWVRDHRVHHKYSETDADPHNSNRGFFFAHVGWLMQKKHPDVIKKGKQIDMSDILEDKLVSFHHKYFTQLKLIFCFIMPVVVPHYCWNESWTSSILGMAVLRYVMNLNFTWLVNSAAHIWGDKPYDKNINPAQNLGVAIVAMGEGWHNYHHVFPWDYKAAELGDYKFNITTFWIDQFAKIGWAYDLKSPSEDLVKRVVLKYGDGSHSEFHHQHKEIDKEGKLVDCSDNWKED